MDMKKIATAAAAIAAALAISACATSTEQNPQAAPSKTLCAALTPSTPKFTKAMFYKNGKFDKEAAKEAYFDMMKRLGYPVSETLRKNMWVTDFELGDFPAVGMAGIFWAHENVHGVFGHEIFLLPNQMLIEHRHVVGKGLPAKNECWMARAGEAYCFGEAGDAASKYPFVKVPDSQKNFVSVHKVSKADSKVGNTVWLNRLEASHYMIAGPEGAVVTEYGAFHDSDNNRYTNPKVGF